MSEQTDPTTPVAEARIERAEPHAGNGWSNGGGETDTATAVFAPEALEPTAIADLDEEMLGALGAAPAIAPSAAPAVGALSGTYRSAGAPFQVELRVDIDGARATRRLSADYYSVSGGTLAYFGSMRVDAITVKATPAATIVTGVGSYTWHARAPRVKVTLPQGIVPGPPATATLQHLTSAGGGGPAYVCRRRSPWFRQVLFEQDRQETVPAPFTTYDTSSLPSGGPARTLGVREAYAEAGIDMQTSGVTDVVSTAEAQLGGTWSDAELHAAMVRHFSLWKDIPQWAVWLFHAQLHDIGPNLLGIMFDQAGHQRQGAAVFYAGLGGSTPAKRRQQLYACTHELGHSFNLMHSWQKSAAVPPGTNRPDALSWMNYPQRFPAGEAAFWSAFPFAFDNQELIHLRHGFRDDVIQGGSPFTVGAALEDAEAWRTPIQDRSGLRLELRTPDAVRLGAPVSVELRLSATDTRGVPVHEHLRPRNGTVEIAIRKPNDSVVSYRPLLHHCQQDEGVVLGGEQSSISEMAFIGYGKDGFYFEAPGVYRLRARYGAPDGSVVLSEIATLRVRSPLTEDDEAVADLLFGDEQGMLLYLVGSDADELAKGSDALREIVARYGEHPLASVARLVLGTNEAREFKQVEADNTVRVRAPRPEEAEALLGPVLDVGQLRGASAVGVRKLAGSLPDDLAAFMVARRREIAAEVTLPE
jgi:hypothetical protein